MVFWGSCDDNDAMTKRVKRRRRGRVKHSLKGHYGHVLADIGIVASSILIAIILVQTDVLTQLLDSADEFEMLGSFIAGVFFTSVFTTAPAIATLGQVAITDSLPQVALIGAAGAVVGDFLMFRFIKDRVSESIMEIAEAEGWLHRIKVILKRRAFRWSAFLLGGILIAAPLPTDELGISLMGFAKMKLWMFFVISYAFNAIGITLIGLTARALAG